MTPATVFGLAGVTLLLAHAAILVVSRLQSQRTSKFLAVGLAVLIGYLPVHGTSLVEYGWSLIGHLSVTTLLLLVHGLLQRTGFPAPHEPAQFAGLMRLVACVSVLFYPFALGFAPIDPYAWGYHPFWILLGMFGIFLVAMFRQRTLIANVLTAAALGWLLDLYGSENLWDYLLDPLLAFYALGYLGWNHGGRRLWQSHGWNPAPQSEEAAQHGS